MVRATMMMILKAMAWKVLNGMGKLTLRERVSEDGDRALKAVVTW